MNLNSKLTAQTAFTTKTSVMAKSAKTLSTAGANPTVDKTCKRDLGKCPHPSYEVGKVLEWIRQQGGKVGDRFTATDFDGKDYNWGYWGSGFAR